MTEITTEQAFNKLESDGFIVKDIWHISDIKRLGYIADEKTAREILKEASSGSTMIQYIEEAIDTECSRLRLPSSSNLFRISGHFADSGKEFSDYVVYEYGEEPDDCDEEIFWYGLSEQDIKDAIDSKQPIHNGFFITSYSVIS
jgi:hypothetical protein